MSHDEFTKLFNYMQKEFASIRQDMDNLKHEVKTGINRLYGLLDADLKKKETDEQERLIMGHQMDRHKGWIKQLAKQTKTKLVPEP